MKSLKYLFAAMLLTCSTASFAQFSNGGGKKGASKIGTAEVNAWQGVRLSYDHTTARIDYDGADNQGYNGLSIGYVKSFSIAKKLPIFFETGLSYNFARYKETETYDDEGYGAEASETITTMGLTLPLNFVYGLQINDKLCFKPYTGFYLRVNLSSKRNVKVEFDDPDLSDYNVDEDYNFFDKKEVGKDAVWNRCQFGWQIGGTLDINKFNVGISYKLDFNEIAEKTKCGIFQATVGYNF